MESLRGDERVKLQTDHAQLLKNIMDSAYDAVVLLDDRGKVIEWNPGAERIFGYVREAVIGLDLHNLVCMNEEKKRFDEAFPLFQHTGKGPAVGKILEMMAVDHQGRMIPIELSLSSFFIEEKWYAMGIVRDITARKAVEETLQRAKEEAEKASAARASFVANMSHELRTPLHGMIGMQSLLEKTDLDKEQAECLQVMKDAAMKLLQLVDDLLDMSKLEKGVKQLNEEPFYLGEELAEAMESFHKMAAIKGLEWRFDNPLKKRIKVKGDKEKLIRAACHLITNALKFTAKGSIVIEASLVNLYEDLGIFRLSVTDTGIGIGDKDLPFLFDHFYQRDASFTRLYEGAGVGLPLVKRFIELMGGNVHVTSEVEKGSTFTIELPLKVLEMDPELRERFKPKDTQQEKTILNREINILVAEDDQTTRLLMKKILATFGMKADIVENGLDAIQRYTSKKYDMVLMDIQMPIMDGIETVQMMREYDKETGESTPVVALTAYASDHEKAVFMAHGMDDMLRKPFDMKQVYEMIQKWTSG